MDVPGAETYRPPTWWVIMISIVILALLLTALGFLASYFQDPKTDGISGPAMGIVAYAGAFALLLGVIEAKLVITEDGISVWRIMHRTTIPWDSIKAFDIGARARSGPLTQLDVILDAQRFPIPGTIGSGKRVAAIMADLTAAQRQHLATKRQDSK